MKKYTVLSFLIFFVASFNVIAMEEFAVKNPFKSLPEEIRCIIAGYLTTSEYIPSPNSKIWKINELKGYPLIHEKGKLKFKNKILIEPPYSPESFDFSYGGKFIWCKAYNPNTREKLFTIYSIEEDQNKIAIKVATDVSSSIAVSSDGKLYAMLSNNILSLYNIKKPNHPITSKKINLPYAPYIKFNATGSKIALKDVVNQKVKVFVIKNELGNVEIKEWQPTLREIFRLKKVCKDINTNPESAPSLYNCTIV